MSDGRDRQRDSQNWVAEGMHIGLLRVTRPSCSLCGSPDAPYVVQAKPGQYSKALAGARVCEQHRPEKGLPLSAALLAALKPWGRAS